MLPTCTGCSFSPWTTCLFCQSKMPVEKSLASLMTAVRAVCKTTTLISSVTALNVPSMTASVTLLEPLGGDMIVHLEIAGQAILAKLDAHADVTVGKSLTLFLRPDRIHLFEESDEAPNVALPNGPQPAGAAGA